MAFLVETREREERGQGLDKQRANKYRRSDRQDPEINGHCGPMLDGAVLNAHAVGRLERLGQIEVLNSCQE